MTSAQFILFSHMVLTVFVFVFVFLCQNQYFLFLSLLICLSLPSFRLTERLSLSTLPADLSEGRFFCFSRRSARIKKNLARKRVLLYFSLARQMILCCATHISLSSPCSAVNSFFLAFQKKMWKELFHFSMCHFVFACPLFTIHFTSYTVSHSIRILNVHCCWR